MPEIGFYHLTRFTIEEALVQLLGKALERRQRVVVRSPSNERVEGLDRALWTKGKESFLPHGTMADPDPEMQPVYLTTGNEAPNEPKILILLDDAPAEDALAFDRVLEVFDGRDADAVQKARERWRWAAGQGFERVYWQQDEAGRWRKGG